MQWYEEELDRMDDKKTYFIKSLWTILRSW